MAQPPRERIGFFRRLGRVLTALRAMISNIIFVVVLVFIVMLFLSAGDEVVRVKEDSALVLRLDAPIVEQAPRLDLTDLLMSGQGAPRPIEMRSLLRALEAAADDPRLTSLVLDLDKFPGAPPATLIALGDAIRQFRDASGKPVVVKADTLTQSQYYLATHADELYLNPMGQILLTGLALQPTYFGSALERLRVNMNVFRQGDYKSAVEPFLQDGMSEAARADASQLLDGVWAAIGGRMAGNRGLSKDELDGLIEAQPDNLRRTDGDLARMALETGLVDELLTRDAAIERMIGRTAPADDGLSFRQIGHRDYLRALGPRTRPSESERIAVVVAEGAILGGEQPVGVAVGEQTLRQLREARKDDDVRAVVLRVNSPGGSAFASELIRRELELLQVAGKPVVVSMGAVAASGGYWIGATADRILAEPATITGSIGVYALLPTFEDSAAALGIHSDGVRTHSLGGAGNPLQPLQPQLADILEQRVAAADRQFRELVARGRGLEMDAVSELAEGRIWSGADAVERDLVDALGGLNDALDSAAELARLDTWEVDYLEPPRSSRELILERMLQSRMLATATDWLMSGQSASWLALLMPQTEQQQLLRLLQDRQQLQALCLNCAVKLDH